MNMDKFPMDVWTMHRKLFHRFIKYRKYFIKATSSLPEYKDANVKKEPACYTSSATTVPVTSSSEHVICLLSCEDDEDDGDIESSRTYSPYS